MVNYSADVAGLVSASPDSWLWGWLHGPVGAESEQFPGLTILLLLAVGVTWCQVYKRTLRVPKLTFYGGAAVLMWLLSLGPAPKMAGTAIGIPGPYAVLAALPGFDGIRVPARFWMVTVLCLAICAAIVVARIPVARTRRTVAALAIAGFLLDAWPRAFPVVAAPGFRVTTGAAHARLGLPLHEAETETMFGAIPQNRPVFNGYSGYAAPQHAALRDLLEQRDPAILDRLAATQPIEVIVESAGDADGQWNAFVQAHPRATRLNAGPDWTAYEIGVTNARPPSAMTGPSLPVTRIEASANAKDIGAVLDNDLDTRWHAVPQSGGETITVSLDGAHHVSALVLCLGTYASQYPRRLDVEVSSDAVAWTRIYTGGTALDTYDAALRSPREIPITVPVNRDGVKFVRLRQTGREPRRGWTIVELRLLGRN